LELLSKRIDEFADKIFKDLIRWQILRHCEVTSVCGL